MSETEETVVREKTLAKTILRNEPVLFWVAPETPVTSENIVQRVIWKPKESTRHRHSLTLFFVGKTFKLDPF